MMKCINRSLMALPLLFILLFSPSFADKFDDLGLNDDGKPAVKDTKSTTTKQAVETDFKERAKIITENLIQGSDRGTRARKDISSFPTGSQLI